jgi:LmbE family N-acetylglucosaminyl deacetylase
MIHLTLEERARGKLKILCLGSHSDDIEIGCGGTILQLAEQYPGAEFHWVVSALSEFADLRRDAQLSCSPARLKVAVSGLQTDSCPTRAPT